MNIMYRLTIIKIAAMTPMTSLEVRRRPPFALAREADRRASLSVFAKPC